MKLNLLSLGLANAATEKLIENGQKYIDKIQLKFFNTKFYYK